MPVNLVVPTGLLPLILRPSNAPLALTEFVDEAFVEMAERSPDFVKAIARGEIEEFFHQTQTVTPVAVPHAPPWRGPNGELEDDDGNEIIGDGRHVTRDTPPPPTRGPNGEELRVFPAVKPIEYKTPPTSVPIANKVSPVLPTPEQEAAIIATISKVDEPITEPTIEWPLTRAMVDASDAVQASIETANVDTSELPMGKPDQTWSVEQIIIYMRNNSIASPSRITKPALLRAIANASVQETPIVITPVTPPSDNDGGTNE